MKQRFLAIETSSARLSLAVGTERVLVDEYQGPLEWRHAETLFEGMRKLLAKARWPVQSLTGVAVSTGPGSFTGIRIGLAAARALGQALEVPVVGVSSLRTLAAGGIRPGEYACPVINALRGDVFTALYQWGAGGKVQTLMPECRLPLQELIEKLSAFVTEPVWLTGDGTKLYGAELKETAGARWRFASGLRMLPRAGMLLELSRPALARGSAGSYKQVVPLYLRSAAAAERRARQDFRRVAGETSLEPAS